MASKVRSEGWDTARSRGRKGRWATVGGTTRLRARACLGLGARAHFGRERALRRRPAMGASGPMAPMSFLCPSLVCASLEKEFVRL